jgi:hypothetical protein
VLEHLCETHRWKLIVYYDDDIMSDLDDIVSMLGWLMNVEQLVEYEHGQGTKGTDKSHPLFCHRSIPLCSNPGHYSGKAAADCPVCGMALWWR